LHAVVERRLITRVEAG